MARSLKFLESLPPELQEKVLEELSVNKSSSLEDIEIDGKMYKAHKAVLDLIDGLVSVSYTHLTLPTIYSV